MDYRREKWVLMAYPILFRTFHTYVNPRAIDVFSTTALLILREKFDRHVPGFNEHQQVSNLLFRFSVLFNFLPSSEKVKSGKVKK